MAQDVEVKYGDSLVGAAINAAINGAIAWFTFRGTAQVPMTLDLISTQEKSVWGQGVSLALALGVILTLLAAKVFSGHVAKAHPELASRVKRPMFPTVAWMAVNNAMSLFGWFVVLAVLWQRTLGTIYVSPMAAAVLVGLFAGIVTVLVEVRTKRALLR
jgi:hypothetical protein